ncbi:Protein bric-a-brac 2 [Nymphon striatum]|nr:Protein bric-a-brac 2 [Nymphon striatum]
MPVLSRFSIKSCSFHLKTKKDLKMANQQFCLKWNNHQGNLVSVFDNLLSSESFVDVTLACEGSNIKAHKVVLSACSPFFEEVLKNNPCKHPIIILKDMKFFDLKTIIQFMYKGEVNVSQDHLSALLKTAESLQVKGLAEVNAGDSQPAEDKVTSKPQQFEQVTSQPIQRKRPSSPPKRTRNIITRDDTDRNRNTGSPEIIEEVVPKKTRIETRSGNSAAANTSSSHYKQQSTSSSSHYNQPSTSSSSHYNQQSPYSDQNIAETYSPQTENTPDNFRTESQKDNFVPDNTEQPQSTSEFQFTSGPANILSEESNNSFSMMPETDEKDIKDIKPSSPQVLPIQIDQEVTGRIKSPPNYNEYTDYEEGNSQVSCLRHARIDDSEPGLAEHLAVQAYDDNSFQGQSASYEISGDSINLDDLGAGPSNVSGDFSNTMPAGTSSGRNLFHLFFEIAPFTLCMLQKIRREGIPLPFPSPTVLINVNGRRQAKHSTIPILTKYLKKQDNVEEIRIANTHFLVKLLHFSLQFDPRMSPDFSASIRHFPSRERLMQPD